MCLVILWNTVAPSALSQARPDEAAHRNATEEELESIAIIERKVMVPMRDGKRMQADIYRPKDQSRKYPIIFVRTPYNFNYWDVELGAPADMSTELEAVKHGYAYVEMNERGRYFSEGDYDNLGTLVHCRVAAGRGLARQQGPHYLHSGELRCQRRPGRPLLRAR
jgi:predicted acyl esterase